MLKNIMILNFIQFKYMTHSDLTNRGKRNGNKETIEKDFLYYLTVEEMHNIEKTQKKPFESAKQSNIGVPPMFFNTLGVSNNLKEERVNKKHNISIFV